MRLEKRALPFAVAMAFAIAAGAAGASGFQLIEQNASGTGNAFAGQAAAAENASTIFFNPAGMTYLPGRQISGALHGIRPSAKFSNDGGSAAPSPLLPLGTNGGDAGDWNYVPNAYLSWQLSPNLWAGVGVTAPFGLKTDYDTTFIGRFQSQKTELKTYDINPSVAYRINDTVSIGAGVSYQHAKLTLDRSFSLVATAAAESVNIDDNAWGWNLGTMFNLGTGTRLGLSYRSAMNYHLSGNVGVAGLATTTASAAVRMPSTVSAALSHQLNDRWQLLGDVTWTRWSAIKNVPLILTSTSALGAAGTAADVLDLQFRNSYRVGVGANYRWNDNFTLKVGTAYDRTPVPDMLHRTVFLPDNSRIWLALGGKYQVSKTGTIDFGYAHLFINDAGIFRNKGTGLAAGRQGIVSGSYRERVDIVSIQYSHSF